MKKKILTVFGCSLLGVLICQPVSAAGTAAQLQKQTKSGTSINVHSKVIEIEGRLGVGYLNGESNELVYSEGDGAKLSQLIWKLDNVFMLNAGVSVRPRPWIKLNADIWFALNEGDNTMDDYDWAVSGWDWTHWSHHEDVRLEHGGMFDINVEVPVYRHQATTFTALIGFKRDNWEWKSYGGRYVYSIYDLHDTQGTFDANEIGITYEQTWNVPYVGFSFYSVVTNWDISGRVIGSPLVKGEDKDIHHMRDLLFEEDFDTSWMWAADLALTYKLSPHWGLTGLFSYQYYDEAKGETTITDLITGEQWYYPGDSAGADNVATTVSLRLDCRF